MGEDLTLRNGAVLHLGAERFGAD